MDLRGPRCCGGGHRRRVGLRRQCTVRAEPTPRPGTQPDGRSAVLRHGQRARGRRQRLLRGRRRRRRHRNYPLLPGAHPGPYAMRWRRLAASCLLAACVPQLTGAPCRQDDNCPVNQYCDGTSCQSGPPPATRVVQVVVTTPAGILPLGATVQANASAVLQSGGQEDVTSSATWTSSDARVAQVSDDGAVLAVATGEVDVTATLGTNSGSAHLVVTDAQLVSVVVTVDRPVVAPRTD